MYTHGCQRAHVNTYNLGLQIGGSVEWRLCRYFWSLNYNYFC
jgi:hypothetical protein